MEFFKFYLNMASLNKESSHKEILDDGSDILAVNVEASNVSPCMFELTNATMMDMT